MIWQTRSGRGNPHHALIFGGGLIGSAINDALRQQQQWASRVVPWSWGDGAQRAAVGQSLLAQMSDAGRIDVVWAAGVSGFASTNEDMDLEHRLMSETADLACHLATPSRQVVFHLFSSLGGLFEGQSPIDRDTVALARRSYGEGKIRQEQMIGSLGKGIITRIYRPSSVYGFAPNGRRGLFSAVVDAISRNKTLTVYGSANTLRDYVFAPDIGDYVARNLIDDNISSSIDILASGKPTALSEAIFMIETMFNKRLYCRYDSAPHNSLDLTVRMSAIPKALRRTPLPEGIFSIFRGMARELRA